MEISPEETISLALKHHYGAIRRQSRRKRSNRVVMTNEARVLKEIREERKNKLGETNYSLRAVAKQLGKTDSWLSQIENGRADVPTDHRLNALLSVYGLKRKSFYERVRLCREKVTPKSELNELINRMDDEKIKLVLTFSKSILKSM